MSGCLIDFQIVDSEGVLLFHAAHSPVIVDNIDATLLFGLIVRRALMALYARAWVIEASFAPWRSKSLGIMVITSFPGSPLAPLSARVSAACYVMSERIHSTCASMCARTLSVYVRQKKERKCMGIQRIK